MLVLVEQNYVLEYIVRLYCPGGFGDWALVIGSLINDVYIFGSKDVSIGDEKGEGAHTWGVGRQRTTNKTTTNNKPPP